MQDTKKTTSRRRIAKVALAATMALGLGIGAAAPAHAGVIRVTGNQNCLPPLHGWAEGRVLGDWTVAPPGSGARWGNNPGPNFLTVRASTPVPGGGPWFIIASRGLAVSASGWSGCHRI